MHLQQLRKDEVKAFREATCYVCSTSAHLVDVRLNNFFAIQMIYLLKWIHGN